MRTKFFCTNFLNTARGPGHPGKILGTSRIPLFETQGRQSFEAGHEVFGHHPFGWKTPTPPGGLRTQKLNLCAFFLAWHINLCNLTTDPPKRNRNWRKNRQKPKKNRREIGKQIGKKNRRKIGKEEESSYSLLLFLLFLWDAAFLLTIGSFLNTVECFTYSCVWELFCLQLELFITVGAFLLTIEAFCIQWEWGCLST